MAMEVAYAETGKVRSRVGGGMDASGAFCIAGDGAIVATGGAALAPSDGVPCEPRLQASRSSPAQASATRTRGTWARPGATALDKLLTGGRGARKIGACL